MEVAGAVEDYSFWGEQIFQSHCQRSKSFPEECQVFGIAVYYGYVAEKNRFQVSYYLVDKMSENFIPARNV